MNDENLPVPMNAGSELHLASELNPMAELHSSPEPGEHAAGSGMNVRDVLYMLLRHKWKIILLGLAGIGVAARVYLSAPPVYESQGKLLVRYVVDRSAVDGLDSQIKTPTADNHALINSEVEILTSADLIREVAEAVGVDKLLGSEHASLEQATQYIYHNLAVEVIKETNIISVTFSSSDPKIPTLVVQELVKRYFDKHLQVHRSTGTFEVVSKEAADLKKELDATEEELKQLKDSVGIISLSEAKSSLATEVGKTQEELDLAETDLAAQKARVEDLLKSLNVSSTDEKIPTQPVNADVVRRYQLLGAQLADLQKAATELLSKYTPQNPLVRTKTRQIQELEKQRDELVNQYPGILDTEPTVATADTSGSTRSNIASERAILAGMVSKVAALKSRTASLEARMKTISDAAPQIEELERKAELEETNYKQSQASLEKAQVDETLDPSRMPNISIVQTPSPAASAKRNLAKVVLGVAGSGLGLGVGLALLIELILDTTLKRPVEVEKRLQLPLLITIPCLSSSRKQLRLRDKNEDAELEAYESEGRNFAVGSDHALLRPFCEAVRDRLGVFFEVNNMAYKPKLIAVTGLSAKAGASTIAAGLADAFSEFSEGKVLLVDKFISSKGFYNQLMEFKRSDLDYVVFDMPRLGDTSATLPLASFMDTVLLVVEAGKSNRDAVKRAYTQLAARTKVSVVFNKSRSYGPKWLEGDL